MIYTICVNKHTSSKNVDNSSHNPMLVHIECKHIIPDRNEQTCRVTAFNNYIKKEKMHWQRHGIITVRGLNKYADSTWFNTQHYAKTNGNINTNLSTVFSSHIPRAGKKNIKPWNNSIALHIWTTIIALYSPQPSLPLATYTLNNKLLSCSAIYH